MASLADDMKNKARQNPGQIVRWVAAGWLFTISAGDPKNFTEEDFHRYWRSLCQRVPAFHAYEDYSYEHARAALERAAARDELLPSIGLPWTLGASLYPKGRSSTEKDWAYLGKMVAALGAPADALITPFETTNPNAVHYWVWRETPHDMARDTCS